MDSANTGHGRKMRFDLRTLPLITLHRRKRCLSVSLGKRCERAHHDVDILILKLPDDVQICFLSGRHARMPKSARYARDGNTGKQKQRCMRMPKTVDGNNRHTGILAMPGKDTVGRRVVHLAVDENRLIGRKVLHKTRKLHHKLPV